MISAIIITYGQRKARIFFLFFLFYLRNRQGLIYKEIYVYEIKLFFIGIYKTYSWTILLPSRMVSSMREKKRGGGEAERERKKRSSDA